MPRWPMSIISIMAGYSLADPAYWDERFWPSVVAVKVRMGKPRYGRWEIVERLSEQQSIFCQKDLRKFYGFG